MELMKSDKVPDEAFKMSKGKDKDAFLKWMVNQALKFGVQNFRTPLREEILEYLAEHPSLLLTSEVSPLKSAACSPAEVEKDPKKLEEELWLQKYENLTSTVEKKQSEFLSHNSTEIITNVNVTSGNDERIMNKDDHTNLNNLHTTQSIVSTSVIEEQPEKPKQPLTSYDCVPMELSDDEETNKLPDICQSTGLTGPPLLYKGEMMPDQRNQHQTPPADMIVHYGLNNLQLEQTVSPSLYVPYEHVPFNIPQNPNLVIMGNNMQPPLNINMVPPVAPANVFIPPLPQEEAPLNPKKNPDKIQEILRLEELKKKKVMQINLLFNKFKAQQAARAVAPPVKQPLQYGHGVIPSASGSFKPGTVEYNMNISPRAIAPAMVPPLTHVSPLPVVYGTVTPANNEIKNISSNIESKKGWLEKNVRTNLIDVSKIQTGKNKGNEAIQCQKPETNVSHNKSIEAICITETVLDKRPSCAEQKEGRGTTELKSLATGTEQEVTQGSTEINSYAPRTPSIILTNDDTIPSSVYRSNKIGDKEQKQLNWRPPTITLLNGKWTYIEQNEKRAFRLIYSKWILMQKDKSGKWQPLQDDFVKNYSCWKKHFPSYHNEILHHVLSPSCLKSCVKTAFDAIPDPVTYWDFPASVPHDMRPPQTKNLNLKGNIYQISVTPGSGFGFISVHGKWVLLAENEHNQWVIMRTKGKYIAWLDGKWTCNAFPRIIPPALKISEEQYMPKLGLFSKKWITLPNAAMTCKLLFGYWVIFRRNDFGRWNVARDDFANAFTCKKKHFPGDRESIPNPKLGVWKQPPNFHAAQLSCLPSFDNKIFDSIEFPVTSYHFSPTVPNDLRPPKRYLLLDQEIRRYVERDITPDSNFGFVSVNGNWEIRKKTEDGTWIPVETRCPETQQQSEIETKNKELLNSPKIHIVEDTPKDIDDASTSLEGNLQPVDELGTASDKNKSDSKMHPDSSKNKNLVKSLDIHHVNDTTKKVDSVTISSEGKSQPNEKITTSETCKTKPCLKTRWDSSRDSSNSREDKRQSIEDRTSSGVCKSKPDSETRSNSPSDNKIVKSQEKYHVEDASKKVDGAISSPGKRHVIATSTSSRTNKIKPVEKKPSEAGSQPSVIPESYIQNTHTSPHSDRIIASAPKNIDSSNSLIKTKQTGHGTKLFSEAQKCKLVIDRLTDGGEQRIKPKSTSSNLASPNQPGVSSFSENESVSSSKTTRSTDHVSEEARLVTTDKNIISLSSGNKITSADDKNNIFQSTINVSPTPELPENLSTPLYLESRGIACKGVKENNSIVFSSNSVGVKSLKKDEKNNVGNDRTLIRLKTLNEWKKTFQLIPSVPKLTLLNGEWKIISDNPRLKFYQLASGVWQLLQLNSEGQWKPLKDDFTLAKERSRDPNNLEEYMSLIGSNKLDSIPIPVIHSDFPSSVYNKLRPPLVMEYGKERIQVNANSGYACLSIERSWILVKQDGMGTWVSVDDEYKIAVKEKLKNTPEKYLSYSIAPISKQRNVLSPPNLTNYLQKISTAVCPFVELITGNIPDTIVKPITHWDLDGPEEERPPKFALTEVDGKRQWSGIRPNSGLGFILEDNVWVLMKQSEFNEWNECKISSHDGCILGYFLMNNRWVIMRKYILGGKWEALFDHKLTPSTYWDFTGPEEKKPPRNIFLGSKKKTISIHKNSGMGFLKKEDMWLLMEEKHDGWSAVTDGEYECIYKLIDGMWVAVLRNPDGKWIPAPVDCPKLINHWNFNGLPDYAPPRRIIFEENGEKSSKLINEESGMGFILDDGIWILVKEGENGVFIQVNNFEKDTGEVGFEGKNGKFKIIRKDEAGNWIRSKDISEIPSNISKCPDSLAELSFDDKFRNPHPLTYFDIPSHVSEYLKPPKYGLVPSFNCDSKWECIRSNSGYGFIFENDIWRLMKWVFGRGWLLLEELTKMNVFGYKAINGRWVPIKKENNKLIPLFDPFLTPKVVGQCFGSPEDKPPSRVPIDGINIVDVTCESKMGFMKDSCVWILMEQQKDDTWKRFPYPKDSEGSYGYKRVEDSFVLVKKCVDGNWLRVYWDWNTNMWVFVFPTPPCKEYSYKTSECTKEWSDNEKTFAQEKMETNKSLTTLFTLNKTIQKNIVDRMSTSKSYIKSSQLHYTNEKNSSVREELRAPHHIESGINGSLECIEITKKNCVAFIIRNDICLMVAQDFKGWFIPNEYQGYKLIDCRWILMKKDVSGSWLPTFDPFSTPRYFWDTIGTKAPKRVAVYVGGIAKWMDTAFDLNLGFIKDDEVWILMKRLDGDWEIVTDDFKESSTLAFKLIDYRWKRVKKNELGEWIPCSKQISLPVLHTDIIGPKEVSPPQRFHLVNEEGNLTFVFSDSVANVGFEQEDLVWVVMRCNEDYTWSRHPGVYNNEGIYGYKYINCKYTLMMNNNGSWIAEESANKSEKRTNIEVSSEELRKQNRISAANENAEMGIESRKNSEVNKLTEDEIPTNVCTQRRILIDPKEIPVSAFDGWSIPEYLRPPRYITIVKNGKQHNMKIEKRCGRAFIKRNDIWIYVNRSSYEWFVVNDDEGYKLMDNRWVLMRKGPDEAWVPTFDPVSTPRTARDTVGFENRPPERVVVCENGTVQWLNTSKDPRIGFLKENCVWILVKRELNGQWTAAKDDMEEESGLCFKLIDYKWQRVKKDDNGEWIPCSVQLSLPIIHLDILGPPEVTPPSHICIANKFGVPKRIFITGKSLFGFIQKDGVWILMHREKNLEWSKCNISLYGDNSFGYKLINDKWILMKEENDKWIPGIHLPVIPVKTRWQTIKIETELLDFLLNKPPQTFNCFFKLPECQRPPESLPIAMEGSLRRVWFRHNNNYAFHNQNGIWILMKQTNTAYEVVQNTADGLLGHKLIDNRWVVMKKLGRSDWVCTFNPISTPRTYRDTVGPMFERPPLRIVLKEEDLYRWKIVSEDNGLGFVKEKDMWILMHRQSDMSWTKFRENSAEEEFGFKIVDYTWSKFKRSINGIWTPCAQVCLPLLCCDFPIYCDMAPPTRLFYTSYMTKSRRKKFIEPESNLGFQLEDGAWVLMKCQENGTWSMVDIFPEQEGKFGYVRHDRWELVKRDGDRWRVVIKKSGPNGTFLDFNDEDERVVQESDEPLAKKRRLEHTLSETEVLKASIGHNSNSSSSSTEIESEAPAKISIIKSLEEKSAEIYLKNLLSTQIPMTWREFYREPCDKQPPDNIVIDVNGIPKRVSLKINRSEIAFLKKDGYWLAVKRHNGSWKTVHSVSDGLLGYGLVDNRWVIMKNKQENEWIPTFDPISTPISHFDMIGPFYSKPPMRVTVNENGIDRWKIVGEENGLGFIKQEDIWILMSKIGESWIQVTDGSDEEIIGYQIIYGKWTKVKKGKDGIWTICSKKCLPCLHWDYVCCDLKSPPKTLPVLSSSETKKIVYEVIRVDSAKGFAMEDGTWVLKECKADGTWEKVDLLPEYQGSLRFIYRNGWRIQKKGKLGNWIEITELKANPKRLNVQEELLYSAILHNQHSTYIQPRETKNICDPLSSQDSSKLLLDASIAQTSIGAQLSDTLKEESLAENSKKTIWIETPVTYHQFRNAPFEKRPPHSVLIHLDGTLKRILLTQKNTNMRFQKQDDIWILMEQRDQLWKTVQNTDDGLLAYKLVDNRWVIMRKRKESDWIPTFDPITTPRSFFDTVGRRETRPPIRIVLNKNGVHMWQIISEENGFGFMRQGEMWILMKNQTDKSWIEFTDDLNREIFGYNLMNCKWTRFKKNENGAWICHPQVSLPVLHWDFVNGDHVAPPQSVCDCCEAQDKKGIEACLGPSSGKGFQFEDGAWVPMVCAEDGSWSKSDLFPGQQGSFGYMNKDGWKIVRRDVDGNWRFVTKNNEGMWVSCSAKDEPSAPTNSQSQSLEDKFPENVPDKESTPQNDSSLSSTITPTSQVNAESFVSREEATKISESQENSDSFKLLPPLSQTEISFQHKEMEISLNLDETVKVDEVSDEKNNCLSFENTDLDDLLPPLTPNYFHTLSNKDGPVTVDIKVDKKSSDSSAGSSTNSKTKIEFANEESLANEPSLNSVELYLAANPNYELSCPDLQSLLREFRPRDKPNKLIRRKFRLPDGNKVLLTIPKGLPETVIDNHDYSKRQKLNVVEQYLATHPPSEWAAPELKRILCEFEANDLKVSKRPCRYEFLFPDGQRRALSIPRKTDLKNNAAKVLASEMKNILKNYEECKTAVVGIKRKLSEDNDVSKKIKKNKGSKRTKVKEICETKAEKKYFPRESGSKKPGPKSKTCRK